MSKTEAKTEPRPAVEVGQVWVHGKTGTMRTVRYAGNNDPWSTIVCVEIRRNWEELLELVTKSYWNRTGAWRLEK